MPEPYLGDITADVKLVILALNPGDAKPPVPSQRRSLRR